MECGVVVLKCFCSLCFYIWLHFNVVCNWKQIARYTMNLLFFLSVVAPMPTIITLLLYKKNQNYPKTLK